jgi:hypothetical protein
MSQKVTIIRQIKILRTSNFEKNIPNITNWNPKYIVNQHYGFNNIADISLT